MKCSAIVLILFLSISFSRLNGQHLGAYSDFRDHFFIFDHGNSIKAEDLLVQSFKIGGECILYLNNQGNLKLYYNGEISKLEPGGVSEYYATDHIAAYSIFEKLKVIQNGKIVTLSTRCPVFRVQDSLIVFYDKNLESLRVYYDGEISDIESGMVGLPVSNFSSGDNTVAYISSRTNDFKIYYNGTNTTVLKSVEGLSFKAGKDVVAYINPIENTFNVFYQGQLQQLDEFPPKSYKVGDGFVAYVTNTGTFNIFYKGRIITVSDFAPDAYMAEDKIMAFTEYNYTKVFFEGEIIELEAYIPSAYKLDWNSVAYLDNTNRIWLYSKGVKEFLANELVNSFDIYRDLIIMNVKVNRNLIYYQGKFYEGLSY